MSERSSGAGLGFMAVVAMVTCCAVPALISAGVLATVGAVLWNPFIIAAAGVVVGGAVAYALRRHRRSHAFAVSHGTERTVTRQDRP